MVKGLLKVVVNPFAACLDTGFVIADLSVPILSCLQRRQSEAESEGGAKNGTPSKMSRALFGKVHDGRRVGDGACLGQQFLGGKILLQFASGAIASLPMTNSFGAPQVKKWPFVVGDLLLVGVAGWIFVMSGYQPSGSNLAIIVVCLGLGIFFGVLPFLAEFREESRRFDGVQLKSTLEQIGQLESIGELVARATGQWEEIQEQCQSVVKTAGELAKRSQAETDRLIEVTEKADTRERDHLRLEVEKHRRGEREWLEVLVGIMDHVFALHRAAVRSGQAKLIKQIEGFQGACNDICRRVGLSQYVVQAGEMFDEKVHKVLEGREVPENAVIEETLAPGFSFQGQPIRLPMVALTTGDGGLAQSELESLEASATELPEEAPRDPDLFDQSGEAGDLSSADDEQGGA